jgi:predicted DNA-binding protein (UPF0251 family)/predicted Fe-Mo cluster-binding NifX family protein
VSRPKYPRKVGFLPGVTYFKPAGIKIADLKEVVLGHDEIEAIRLKNLQGLSQEEAAEEMNISQPTLHRLLWSAYAKMTDAIVNGKALKIEGGNINVPETSLPECGLGRLCHQIGKRRGTSAKKRNLPENEGTIALTSIDGTLEGMVDERFGRARKLIIYSPTEETRVVENQTRRNLGQGVGIQTAQNIIDCGVRAVITGHLGPNAFRALAAAGIEAYSAINMTVADALNAYRKDMLKRLSEADVPGHWEMERGQGK